MTQPSVLRASAIKPVLNNVAIGTLLGGAPTRIESGLLVLIVVIAAKDAGTVTSQASLPVSVVTIDSLTPSIA